MSMTGKFPIPPLPGGHASATGAGGRVSRSGSLLSAAAILVGSALLGLAGGQIWALLAPRAAYVVVSHGSADVVNPETSAFITADLVYCAIGAVSGLIIGLAGYLLAVRRYGPWPMAAIGAGSAAAGVLTRWIGEHSGLTAFDHHLLSSPLGTHLPAPLALAGDTSATTWPTVASLPDLALWPLAGCAVAGGLVLIGVLRERSAAAQYEAAYPGPQPFGSYPGQ
jgi:hypothetical protein